MVGKVHETGIQSTAAVFGHPIHPLLVPLPITSFIGTLVTDIVYLATKNPFWAQASSWLLVAGVVTGLLAGLAGALDFSTLAPVRRLAAAQAHAVGNVTALIVAMCNILVRWYDPTGRVAWAIALSAATVGILTITGWLGGTLSYKYRIGQIAPDPGGVDPAGTAAE